MGLNLQPFVKSSLNGCLLFFVLLSLPLTGNIRTGWKSLTVLTNLLQKEYSTTIKVYTTGPKKILYSVQWFTRIK